MRILLVSAGTLILAGCGQPSSQSNAGATQADQSPGAVKDQASDQGAAADDARIEFALSRSPVAVGYSADELRLLAIQATSRYKFQHAEVIGMVVSLLKYGIITHRNIPLMIQATAKLATTMHGDLPAALEKLISGMGSTGTDHGSMGQFDMLTMSEVEEIRQLDIHGNTDEAEMRFLKYVIAGIYEPAI